MNKVTWALIVVLILELGLLAACGSLAPTPMPSNEEEPVVQPTATGRPTPSPEKLLKEQCSICHSLDRVTQARKTREEWDQYLTQMINLGAMLSEKQKRILVEYLTETYGL